MGKKEEPDPSARLTIDRDPTMTEIKKGLINWGRGRKPEKYQISLYTAYISLTTESVVVICIFLRGQTIL